MQVESKERVKNKHKHIDRKYRLEKKKPEALRISRSKQKCYEGQQD